jgi:Asp/Glu/hydantoin racemase
MKIGIIHATRKSMEPLEKEVHHQNPEAEVVSLLHENLLFKVNKTGIITKKDLSRFLNLLLILQEAEVDGILIGCSVYCPYASVFEPFIDVPLVAVDQPMLIEAIDTSHKIGVIATTEKAAPTAKKQLLELADAKDKEIEIELSVIPEAIEALNSGDITTHNEIILQSAKELEEKGVETIVLAQVTMAAAEQDLLDAGINVLISPNRGVSALLDRIK